MPPAVNTKAFVGPRSLGAFTPARPHDCLRGGANAERAQMTIVPEFDARCGYALCGDARSGSVLLRQLLMSTGKLGRPLEYFGERGAAISLPLEDGVGQGARIRGVLETLAFDRVYGAWWNAVVAFPAASAGGRQPGRRPCDQSPVVPLEHRS